MIRGDDSCEEGEFTNVLRNEFECISIDEE